MENRSYSVYGSRLKTFLFGLILVVASYAEAQKENLLDSARAFYSKEPARALQLITKFQERSSISKSELLDALQLKGDIHYYIYDSLIVAKQYYDSVLGLAAEDDYRRRQQVLSNFSYILNQQSQHREALNVVHQIFAFPIPIDSTLYFKLHQRIGHSYYLIHSYDSSLYYLGKAKEYYDRIGNERLTLQLMTSVGVVLSESGDLVTAKNNDLEVFKAAEIYKDTSLLAPPAQNLSVRYYDLGQMDSAKYYADLNLVFNLALGSQQGLLQAYGSLARVELGLGNLEEVHRNADKVIAAESSDLLQFQTIKSVALRCKAEAFLKAGALEQALEWALRCREHAGSKNLLAYEERADEVLYEIYKKRGAYRLALYHFEKAKVVQDSLMGAENFRKVKELNTRFESEKRLREINELERKAEIQELTISRQRSNQIFGVAGVLVLAMIGYLFFSQRFLKEKQVRLTTRQKLLRSQLNPHFLYNAMNAIQFVILNGDSQLKASDYVAKFAQLTRQILEHSEEEEILLEDEISFLENYVQIQQLRMQEPFHLKLKWPKMSIQRLSWYRPCWPSLLWKMPSNTALVH